MISEYLMKGIDSLFSKGFGTSIETNIKPFTKDIIKSNLQFVVKQAPKQSKNGNQENEAEGGALNKSRLRMILQKNKDAQIKSVIRRDNSRSTSPYQRISPIGRTSPIKGQGAGVGGDKIAYYREQRKTIEKSRVLEKSRIGGSGSRIFRVGSQLKMGENGSGKHDHSASVQPKHASRY